MSERKKSEYVLRYVSPELVARYNERYKKENRPMCPFCESEDFPVGTWETIDGSEAWAGLGCSDCKSEWTEKFKVRNLGIEEETDLNRSDMLPEDIQAMEDAGWKWDNKFGWRK